MATLKTRQEESKVRARKLLKGLNPQQKEAVAKTMKRPALVIAGAGSGKTKVLTTRVAYLLERGLPEHAILTVTFTNKAAQEMKERIAKTIGKKKAKKITVGTFHSLCVRWLRRWSAEAGLKKNWTIFAEDDQQKLMKTILKNFNMNSEKQTIRAMLGRISNHKNAMQLPKHVRDLIHNNSADNDFVKVYEAYQQALQRNNAVDFDDLIMRMVLLLQMDRTIRARLQKQFKYILVDEYQDTNECQYRLVKYIAGKSNNLFIVGDDYQSIYGWRGADIEKILNFQNDYPNAVVIKLEQNYRSKKTIVQAANGLMTNNERQMQKTCFSDHAQGDPITVYNAFSDMDEAKFVAEEIKNLVDYEGYEYKDIALLYRTNVLSRLFEDQFIYNRIPYDMVSGFSFYERREIKDVLAWVQLSINPDNDVACERVLSITPGIGSSTIKTITKKARETGKTVYTCVERYKPNNARIQNGVSGLTQTVSQLNTIYNASSSVTDTPITDMLDIIFRHTGYLKKLREEATEESIRRVENVQELMKIAGEYEDGTKNPDIQTFLDDISLTGQQDKLGDENQVKMMTLHASKGLEFPVVFMPGCEEGLLPHKNSMGETSKLEEERRLAYVGITRAEDKLYMTHAGSRMNWDKSMTYNDRSRFIDELPEDLLEEL